MSLTRLVKPTRPKRFFYAENVNMSQSFDRLNTIAKELLGAETEVGDIVICDNHNRTKRKVLQKTANGFMIYYGRMDDKSEFTPLASKNGQIKRVEGEIL